RSTPEIHTLSLHDALPIWRCWRTVSLCRGHRATAKRGGGTAEERSRRSRGATARCTARGRRRLASKQGASRASTTERVGALASKQRCRLWRLSSLGRLLRLPRLCSKQRGRLCGGCRCGRLSWLIQRNKKAASGRSLSLAVGLGCAAEQAGRLLRCVCLLVGFGRGRFLLEQGRRESLLCRRC